MKIEFFHDQVNRRTFAVEVPQLIDLQRLILSRYTKLRFKFGRTFMVPKEKNYIKKIGREKSMSDMLAYDFDFVRLTIVGRRQIYTFTNYIYDIQFSVSQFSNNVRLIAVDNARLIAALKEEV